MCKWYRDKELEMMYISTWYKDLELESMYMET
jgi:hypothetical protein